MTRCNYKVGIFFLCYRSGGSGCLPSWVLGSVVLKLLVMITFAFIAAHLPLSASPGGLLFRPPRNRTEP